MKGRDRWIITRLDIPSCPRVPQGKGVRDMLGHLSLPEKRRAFASENVLLQKIFISMPLYAFDLGRALGVSIPW